MKKMDEIGFKLCKIQAEVFSASASESSLQLAHIYEKIYEFSGTAQRMDLGGFLFEACDVHQIFQEIEAEFGQSSYGKGKIYRSRAILDRIYLSLLVLHISKNKQTSI